MARSVPNLAHLHCVSMTPKETSQEEADKALDYLYDRDIELFYEEAIREAATARLLSQGLCSKLDNG